MKFIVDKYVEMWWKAFFAGCGYFVDYLSFFSNETTPPDFNVKSTFSLTPVTFL